MKAARWILGVLGLVALFGATILIASRLGAAHARGDRLTGEAQEAASQASTPTEEAILANTESLIKNYEDVGRYWTGILDDESNSNSKRVYATKALGTMKYPPAVPVLIKQIRLFDESIIILSDNGPDAFASQIALIQFGKAAVPDVITAYLDEESQGRQSMLLDSISSTTGMTYVVGLHAQHDKRVTDEVFRDLEERYGWVRYPKTSEQAAPKGTPP